MDLGMPIGSTQTIRAEPVNKAFKQARSPGEKKVLQTSPSKSASSLCSSATSPSVDRRDTRRALRGPAISNKILLPR